MEASSAGRPTIGFRSTGVRDAITDFETGQLVPIGDAGALAEATATNLSAPELAARHGAAALARVERVFAQEKVFEAVAGLYRDALIPTPPTTSSTRARPRRVPRVKGTASRLRPPTDAVPKPCRPFTLYRTRFPGHFVNVFKLPEPLQEIGA